MPSTQTSLAFLAPLLADVLRLVALLFAAFDVAFAAFFFVPAARAFERACVLRALRAAADDVFFVFFAFLAFCFLATFFFVRAAIVCSLRKLSAFADDQRFVLMDIGMPMDRMTSCKTLGGEAAGGRQ